MIWIAAAYVLISAVGLACAIGRNRTTLLKGEAFLLFNLFFVCAVVLTVIVRRELPTDGRLVLILGLITLASYLLRQRWLLLKDNQEETTAVVEDSFRRVLLPFQKTNGCYRLQVGNGLLQLNFSRLPLKSTLITFRGDAQPRKVRVLQNLLKKKFASLFPKLTINLKEAYAKSN